MIPRLPLLRIAALAAIASLALAAPAAATISITTPTGNPVIAPGATVPVAWSGACPADRQCGLWNYEAPDPGANIAVGMSTVPVERYGVMTLDSGSEVGDGSARATASPFSYALPDFATAGQWYAVASWNECVPKAPTAVNIGSCPIAASEVLPFRVRAVIGLKGSKAPRMDSHLTNGHKALYMRTTFGCNAQARNYRGALTVQKRVRVGKRTRWVTALTRPRVKATRDDSYSTCYVEHAWTLPRWVTRETTVRYTWKITTTGVQPAAKAWKRTSRPFPAAQGL
jgi:hypothetical protein